MDDSLLAVRDINHKYIVVEQREKSEVIRSGKGGQVNDKKNSHCTLCN